VLNHLPTDAWCYGDIERCRRGLWDGLPPAERVGARVITEIQLEELLRKSAVQIIIRELHNVPRLLQEWDCVELLLYTIWPVAAHTPLIQALLALVLEQLKLYRRILEIDPKHPDAKRKKQEIINRQQAKKQQRINTIKGIYDKYSKRMWEFLGFIFALMVSYYCIQYAIIFFAH